MPATAAERILVLEGRMATVERDLRELELEVHGGDPAAPSLRRRLHLLENDALAAKAASEAISALRSKEQELRRERERRWGARQKIALTALSLPVIVIPWVNLAFMLGGR